MIESITVANTATFGDAPQVLNRLSQFNYFFGANGTGKTTISRIIADEERYPDCSITWKNRRPLQTVVLNRDFVDKNFSQLHGVFTLGEQQKEVVEQIAAITAGLEKDRLKLTGLRCTIEGEDGTGGKKAALAELDAAFIERTWALKKKYDKTFHEAFTGYRNNARRFTEKILDESKTNTAALQPLDDLERRAETIFGETPTKEVLLANLSTSSLLAHESDVILQQRVIGKDDVDIAAMIKKLGNSDWVRQGRRFYTEAHGFCPFCQQTTTDRFARSLEAYFDETFENDTTKICKLASAYAAECRALQEAIDNLLASSGKFLDVDQLKAQKAILDQVVSTNQLLLEKKKKEPSEPVELQSLTDICTAISESINAANAQASQHNHLVDNLATEKQELSEKVWRFLLDELELDLANYRTRRTELEKILEQVARSVEQLKIEIRTKESKIRALEQQTTSIQPTIDSINAILLRFGFDNFKLAMSKDKRSYRLIRNDGEDARDTLSDGERTFVAFLYFYYLLQGSTTETDIATERIVVFDDPVSSLDADILFIVSSLIRDVCQEVREGRGAVQQVFVLTHNIYFHKEITFNPKRARGRLREESFWIIRRLSAKSTVEYHEDNPIKTFYELLWMDVRAFNPENTRIENTLRRILEHYFKIFGSVSTDEICARFEGEERLVCRSLFSWVNAGSHQAHDDLYLAPSDSMIQNYLKVFREVFHRTGHIGHYQMMMGEEFVEERTVA